MFAPIKTIASIATAAALIAGASAASAAPALSKSVEVRHGDLDLATPAGQTALKKRISAAAVKACTADNGKIDADCRAFALSGARAPIERAIARAESSERYADAGNMTTGAGQ
jgi:UrcA family protein